MSETGAVKFNCEHVRVALEKFAGFDELTGCRRELLARGWIGVDENGIGFGNLSVREGDTARFFITSSGTAAKRELTPADHAHVADFDFQRNWLRCEGLGVASSESLTHAAVYKSRVHARAVIHIHDLALWTRSTHAIAATSADVEYGTCEMAREICRLLVEATPANLRVFRMAGHRGGLIAFGATPRDALQALIELNQRLRDFSATAQ